MDFKAILALGICSAAATPSSVLGQTVYPSAGVVHCIPTETRLPVYFHAESLVGTGYNVNHLRESLIHAINVWNEESQSRTLMYYAGDGVVPPGQSYGITVTHSTATAHCKFRPQALAYAQGVGAGGQCVGPSSITLYLSNCNSPPTARAFSVFQPDNATYSYEGVLIHELGHAAFGFPDVTQYFDAVGVMWGSINPGPVYPSLHLYPIDQDSAAMSPFREQTTDWQQQSAVYSWPSTWEGPSAFAFGGASPISASIGPALHRDVSGPGVMFGTASERPRMIFSQTRADGGAWVSSGVQPPGAGNGPGYSRLWTRISISDYNEAMVVWSNCVGQFQPCNLYWAFAANPLGGPWISGYFMNLNAFGRPALEYDRYLDRFVLISIDATGAPRTAQTGAQYPVWSDVYTPPSYPSTTGPNGRPLRYLGNVQFQGTDGVGLAVAAADWPEQGLLNALVQMNVTWNYPAQQYDVGAPVFAGPIGAGSVTESFVTGRHFGLAEDRGGPQLVMAWGDGRSTGQIFEARKSSFSSAVVFASSQALPAWPGGRVARSSVDVAVRMQSTFTFFPWYTYFPARVEVSSAFTFP